MAARLKAMGQSQYQNVIYNGKWTGRMRLVSSALDKPLRRQKPTTYFVNSMSDLFHKDVDIAWLERIWWVMSRCPQHTFQILTKRAELLPERVGQVSRAYGVLPNVWIGVSVESQKYAIERIPYLQETPAAVRFLVAL
jgi:protein gp37